MSRPVEPDRRGRPIPRAQLPTAPGVRAVVGFDATSAGRDALAYAIGWARRVHGGLDVLYVADDRWPWIVDAYAAGYPLAAPLDSLGEATRLVADTVSGLLAGCDLAWSYQTVGGGVARALEQHAASVGADAIIIGRRRPRRRRLPSRTSIAQRLLRHTERIVIVVP